MPRYNCSRSYFGDFESFRIRDGESGEEAIFASYGATLLSYSVPFDGELFDITDGYATPEELENQHGGRAWIMAPFSNRIDDGKFRFGDREHDMGVEDPVNRVILHGFLKTATYEALETTCGNDSASILFGCKALRPDAYPGYPWSVDVLVKYTMDSNGLSVEVTAKNVGSEPAPFCCGWHPYFRTSIKGIDSVRLSVPAKKRIVTDSRLLPLEGDKAYADIHENPFFDFSPNRPDDGNVIGSRELDLSYCDLQEDADGWIRTVMEDRDNNRKITVFQDRGLMHVYTGDTIKVRTRKALALEPVEFPTNSFNRPDQSENILLRDGDSRIFRFGVKGESL